MAENKLIPMATMPLRRGHFRVLAVSSMEQIIGTSLSALIGIVIPMIELVTHPELSSLMQGLMGASGLTGIAVGSACIGGLSDRYGYLLFFRLTPLLILVASLLVFFFPTRGMLIGGLFMAGLGVGGGYTLDSDYISEIMPDKWKLFMVGVAKATCSLGFIVTAAVCWWILASGLSPEKWNYLFLILSALGLMTFIMRIPFRQSPRWLMQKGRTKEAQEAVKYFLGSDVEILPKPAERAVTPTPWLDMFKGKNLSRVIFSGIPWACEGVGIYGVGVFLPLLVLALGIEHSSAVGMAKIINSVKLTTVINCFILPGFVLGLCMVMKHSHTKMLTRGFWISALGLGWLLAAYLLHWPVWMSILAFLVFELAINAGPHLVTFIIPAQIYPVADRGKGSGIAAMIGKVGAIAGVFLMPILLSAGGIKLVLIVCISVMVAGALVSEIFGRIVFPSNSNK